MAELIKRGFQAPPKPGNARSSRLIVFDHATGRTYTVQVKAIRRKNVFPIAHHQIHASHVYVFVVLNEPGEPVEYFIVPGALLAGDPARFTKWFVDPRFPGIHYSALRDFADRWEVFEEQMPRRRVTLVGKTMSVVLKKNGARGSVFR